jgi:hypothetical protein
MGLLQRLGKVGELDGSTDGVFESAEEKLVLLSKNR